MQARLARLALTPLNVILSHTNAGVYKAINDLLGI